MVPRYWQLQKRRFYHAEIDSLGKYETRNDGFDIHIKKILALPMVDKGSRESEEV